MHFTVNNNNYKNKREKLERERVENKFFFLGSFLLLHFIQELDFFLKKINNFINPFGVFFFLFGLISWGGCSQFFLGFFGKNPEKID